MNHQQHSYSSFFQPLWFVLLSISRKLQKGLKPLLEDRRAEYLWYRTDTESPSSPPEGLTVFRCLAPLFAPRPEPAISPLHAWTFLVTVLPVTYFCRVVRTIVRRSPPLPPPPWSDCKLSQPSAFVSLVQSLQIRFPFSFTFSSFSSC